MASDRREYRVPYSPRGTTYTERESEAFRALIDSPETLSCGPQRRAFELEFASYVGVDPDLAVATSSCTVALELATHLCGIGPGDNVVVTPQSYQATLNPLLGMDVEVRFGDVDANTLCLDPASIVGLIDERTRALFLTHYGGLMVDMPALHRVVDSASMTIVEDCAHAHGSSLNGRRAGAWGNVSCFSFQSMKNMSTLGQGGMMLLPDRATAQRARKLIAVEPDADFIPRARNDLDGYTKGPDTVFTHDKNAFSEDCVLIRRHGTNATLPEPAAAVGRVQLDRLPEFLARRSLIAAYFDAAISEIPGIKAQTTPGDQAHSNHLYTCFVERNNVAMAEALVELGIEVQQRYFPLHLLPEWRARGGCVGSCPVAERIWFESHLNLPIYPAMTDDQVEYVATALKKAAACI